MATACRTKPRRKDVPADTNLCEYCTAKCCHYFALPIETPEEFTDFEYIRWFLLHERATVFKEEEDWYLLVHTTCRHLRDDNRCGIYETRPQICREYSTKDCEYRRRLDVRVLLGTARAGGRVHGGRAATNGTQHPQPETAAAADFGVSK